MEEFYSTSSILAPITPPFGLIQSPNPPDITPSFGRPIPNAITRMVPQQSTMENFITISSYLLLITKEEATSMMLQDELKDYTCETGSQNPAICALSISKPEGMSRPVMSASIIANSNGSLIKATSTIPSGMLPKLQRNVIASALDWPKMTSKTHLKPREQFFNLLKEHLVINNRQYESFLSNNPILAELETKMSTNSLELLMKTIFRQNLLNCSK